MRNDIITILEQLNAFYCEPAEDVIYVSVCEGEETEGLIALYNAICAASTTGWHAFLNAWGEPTGREVCTLQGLTIEWEWESLE